MTNEEALELLKDTNLILRCSFTGDIRIVEAIDLAIKALGKDTNVPTNSALDHIHNIVKDDAYKRGYEQGKANAIPVDWIEGYLSDCAEWSIAYYVIKQMLYKWREEQERE